MSPRTISEPSNRTVNLLAASQPRRQESQKNTPSQPEPRPPDVIWDTLADLFGAPTNRGSRGKRNKAVQLIRESEAVPDVIRTRAAAWPAHFPGAALTDMALAVHWDELGRPPKRASPQEQRMAEVAARNSDIHRRLGIEEET